VGPQVHTIEFPVVEAIAAGVCLKVPDEDALVAALSPNGWAGPTGPQIEAFFQTHAGATKRTLAAIQAVIGR
jgi:3-deoxy-D-manno-octulosonic-acid transferase